MTRPTNLPDNANTWGFDGDRLVYLVRFNDSYPMSGICSCGDTIRLDDWEKHSLTHRVWRYADTGERHERVGLLTYHRFCECGTSRFIAGTSEGPQPPMWCYDCGGYISILLK